MQQAVMKHRQAQLTAQHSEHATASATSMAMPAAIPTAKKDTTEEVDQQAEDEKMIDEAEVYRATRGANM